MLAGQEAVLKCWRDHKLFLAGQVGLCESCTTGRDGILRNPGIPGFFGTGLTYFFHPGIDGIPGFFGTGLALYFYPGIFWKN